MNSTTTPVVRDFVLQVRKSYLFLHQNLIFAPEPYTLSWNKEF